MLETKDNYAKKFSDDLCPVCDNGVTKDSQQHLMLCQSILSQRIVKSKVKYEDLFASDVQKQLEISSIIIENFKRRKGLELCGITFYIWSFRCCAGFVVGGRNCN